MEQWDCHQCGICCRGSTVRLDDADRQQLAQQGWQQHPDFVGTPVVVAEGWWQKSYRLAQRDDGACVFLTADGLCRIHQQFGLQGKPLMCQMFPLQLVPLEKQAILTIRRSCPSAAADRGRPLADHQKTISRLAAQRHLLDRPIAPPHLSGRKQTSWKEALQVMEALERLLVDNRFPLVRRLVHALVFCRTLDACRLGRLTTQQLIELVALLEQSAPDAAAHFFRDRPPPTGAAAVLFRQTAAQYVRLHPGQVARPENVWVRLSVLRTALQMARGKGALPSLHPLFPPTTYEALERPLGALPEDVLRPLNRFFETMAASKQYALTSRTGWSLSARFRALALSYPLALWLLRWRATSRAPTADDMLAIVTALDRAQGYAALCGRRHRRQIATLVSLDQLERLMAWYAR